MALFNSCYASEEGTEEVGQNGCGLVGIGALDPLVETFKKSLLSASEAVIKRLRHRQVGRGRKLKKRQIGSGRRKKKKNQQGGGKKKQQGAGRKKRKNQQGGGKKSKRKG